MPQSKNPFFFGDEKIICYYYPMDDYKQQLGDLLTTTAKQNASDLHLAVGRKPTLRMDGVLIPLERSRS